MPWMWEFRDAMAQRGCRTMRNGIASCQVDRRIAAKGKVRACSSGRNKFYPVINLSCFVGTISSSCCP